MTRFERAVRKLTGISLPKVGAVGATHSSHCVSPSTPSASLIRVPGASSRLSSTPSLPPPQHVIEILFFVLDLDGSGDLDWAEVQQIMHSKSAGSAWDVSQGSGKASLVECMRSCLRQARA